MYLPSNFLVLDIKVDFMSLKAASVTFSNSFMLTDFSLSSISEVQHVLPCGHICNCSPGIYKKTQIIRRCTRNQSLVSVKWINHWSVYNESTISQCTRNQSLVSVQEINHEAKMVQENNHEAFYKKTTMKLSARNQSWWLVQDHNYEALYKKSIYLTLCTRYL